MRYYLKKTFKKHVFSRHLYIISMAIDLKIIIGFSMLVNVNASRTVYTLQTNLRARPSTQGYLLFLHGTYLGDKKH